MSTISFTCSYYQQINVTCHYSHTKISVQLFNRLTYSYIKTDRCFCLTWLVTLVSHQDSKYFTDYKWLKCMSFCLAVTEISTYSCLVYCIAMHWKNKTSRKSFLFSTVNINNIFHKLKHKWIIWRQHIELTYSHVYIDFKDWQFVIAIFFC